MQRFRSQGAATAVPARRLSSPGIRSKARTMMPLSMCISSPSLPSPRRPPSREKQAQQDLTQKLRAMDLALERIESEDCMKKYHNSLTEKANSDGAKENLNPLVLGNAWESLHGVAAGFDASGCQSSTRGRLASPLRSSTMPFDHPLKSRCHSDDILKPKAQMVDPPLSDALEARWGEAHAALRSELTQALESLREGWEEQKNSSVRLLSECEVELTAAFETRMREVDTLVERRLIEAGEGMQQSLRDFEASATEEREKFAAHERDSKERLDEMERILKAGKAVVSEQTKSIDSAKEQLTTCRQGIHQLQEECKEAKEHLARCRQQIQQLQEEREDTKEQLLICRQRVDGVDSAVSNSSCSDVECRHIVSEIENRLRRLEDGLAARFQESECRVRSSASEEIAGLRLHVQPLLVAANESAMVGGRGIGLSAEAERRLQNIDESCTARICGSESRLLAQQRALEGQTHDIRHELQRLIGDLGHRLFTEVRLFGARPTNSRLEDRFDDFQRASESDVAALRERLHSFELRCFEEARDLFRRDLHEFEARCMSTTEANTSSQLDSFREELRGEVWPRSPHDEKDPFSMGALQNLLAQSEEERCALSGQLEILADRQKRQQLLLEDLLSAAARQSSLDGVTQLGNCGSLATSSLPQSSPTQACIEAFVSRLASVEDRINDQTVSNSSGLVSRIVAVENQLASVVARRPVRDGGFSNILSGSDHGSSSVATAAVELAEGCSGRLDLLTARVTSVEDRVAVSTAPVTASLVEVQEALRAWPPKLKELSERLHIGSNELRRELTKELQEGLESWQAECAQQRAEVVGLKAALQKADEESGNHHTEMKQLVAWFPRISGSEQAALLAESTAVAAVEQAQCIRQLAEKAEQSCSKRVAAVELDLVKSRARSESESQEFATRLEARIEDAEARQLRAFTALSERLEGDLKRDAQQSSKYLAMDSCVADVDLRWSPAFRCNRGSSVVDEQTPWFKAMRNLECHLKALMAAQAEDSAEAFRSMAQMVEEHSMLKRNASDLKGNATMIAHSGLC